MNDAEPHALFERWLTEHASILHHVAHGFATGADRDDLRQELLLALWRAMPAFRGDALPSTFIYRVAHNAALTWKRSQRRYRERVESFETLASPPAASPAEAGPDRERLEQVYAQIRLLPPLDRSLLLLHLDDLSYTAIAEIHGLTESNVGARLSRLKPRLITALQALAHELR